MTGLDLGAARGAASSELAFVLVRPTDPEYEGRARIRRAVLTLAPLADTTRQVARGSDAAGFTWKLVAPNGLTTALRARDFPTEEAVRGDLARLRRRDGFRSLAVQDAAGERFSFWVLQRSEVVVVSVRLLPATRRSMLRYESERVLRALRDDDRAIAAVDPGEDVDP